jgi:hypothetical protein
MLAAVGAGSMCRSRSGPWHVRFEGRFEPHPPAVAIYDTGYAAYTALCERIYGR